MLTDYFQYQRQFIDIYIITQWDQKKNVQITDILKYFERSL